MTDPRTTDRDRPITGADRVSDVLARDEALIDVFVRQAPHFEKLRNRAMRKVMARLVTVEQAARTANVPAAQLIQELNAALGIANGAVASPERPAADQASELTRPASAPVVDVDVREELRAGNEPFAKIMAAVGSLGADEVLHLRAIFEPAPLYSVLAKRGFVHQTAEHAPDDWSVWFWKASASELAAPGASTSPTASAESFADDATTSYIDVRGLTPPEPMLRTLAALESLPPEHTLVQINTRVPQFLLPMLAERGYAWELDESRAERVLVRIRRAQ